MKHLVPFVLTVLMASKVSSQPTSLINIDRPADGSTVALPFLFGGWALDLSATSGVGVDAVHVWAFPPSAPPTFVGTATLGINRPDVGSVFGAQFTSSGYDLTALVALPEGSVTLRAFAHSSVSGQFDAVAEVEVTVRGTVLNDLQCNAGDVVQWTGAVWTCAAPSGPPGPPGPVGPAGPQGPVGPFPLVIVGGGALPIDSNPTVYAPLFGAPGISNDDVSFRVPLPLGGTLSNFHAHTAAAPGAGESVTFIVRKNGANTASSCTISNNATDCTDLATEVAFAAGDLINVQMQQTLTAGSGRAWWTASYQVASP